MEAAKAKQKLYPIKLMFDYWMAPATSTMRPESMSTIASRLGR